MGNLCGPGTTKKTNLEPPVVSPEKRQIKGSNYDSAEMSKTPELKAEVSQMIKDPTVQLEMNAKQKNILELAEKETAKLYEEKQRKLREMWEGQEILRKEKSEADEAEANADKEKAEQIAAEAALAAAEAAGEEESRIEELKAIAEKEKQEAEEAEALAAKEKEEQIAAQAQAEQLEQEAKEAQERLLKAQEEGAERQRLLDEENLAQEAEAEQSRLEAMEAELAAGVEEEKRLAEIAEQEALAKAAAEAEAETQIQENGADEEGQVEKKVMSAAEKKKWRQKKNKLLKKIKDQMEAGDVDEEGASKIAEQWMAIADVDESGTVDFGEFKEFIGKLEEGQEEQSTEDGLKGVFDSIDVNGNGELDVEEFGKALFQIVGPEEGNDDVEE